MLKITNHVDLCKIVNGDSILIANSLGKDAAASIELLSVFCPDSKIVSVTFEMFAKHPDDDIYLNHQKKRYPKIEFITRKMPIELDAIKHGTFQSPVDMLLRLNSKNKDKLDFHKYLEEIRSELGLKYISCGHAKYESMQRGITIYKKGLLHSDNWIYPIGHFFKRDLINLLKTRNIKIHPCYKFSQGTYDAISFYKMRNNFVGDKQFKKNVFKYFPLLVLDEFRYTFLFKNKRKNRRDK